MDSFFQLNRYSVAIGFVTLGLILFISRQTLIESNAEPGRNRALHAMPQVEGASHPTTIQSESHDHRLLWTLILSGTIVACCWERGWSRMP